MATWKMDELPPVVPPGGKVPVVPLIWRRFPPVDPEEEEEDPDDPVDPPDDPVDPPDDPVDLPDVPIVFGTGPRNQLARSWVVSH